MEVGNPSSFGLNITSCARFRAEDPKSLEIDDFSARKLIPRELQLLGEPFRGLLLALLRPRPALEPGIHGHGAWSASYLHQDAD